MSKKRSPGFSGKNVTHSSDATENIGYRSLIFQQLDLSDAKMFERSCWYRHVRTYKCYMQRLCHFKAIKTTFRRIPQNTSLSHSKVKTQMCVGNCQTRLAGDAAMSSWQCLSILRECTASSRPCKDNLMVMIMAMFQIYLRAKSCNRVTTGWWFQGWG